jgi:beta-phosphoglucomutase-like phosphatase (HAD superfamily)
MKNILFDVDGVIVDTEKLNLESWKLIYKIKDELFSTLYFSELV